MKIYGLNFYEFKKEIPFYRFYIKDNNEISKIYMYEDYEVFAIDVNEEYIIANLPEIQLFELSFNEKFMNILKKSDVNNFKSNDEKSKKMFIKLKEILTKQ